MRPCHSLRSAVWFPLHSKGCQADYVCTPAPIHNPDGTESLWCYTRPAELYGTLRDRLGHFPLQHFWGPMANVQSSRWIADSAVFAAEQWRPDFFYIYLPHLDYAAQRNGPDSVEADAAVAELDQVIGQLAGRMGEAYGEDLFWLVAGEYAITPVDHVAYPNRVLRQAGLLTVRQEADGEHLDLAASRAWALVDHQFSHVFISDNGDGDRNLVARVADIFRGQPGIAEVLVGDDLVRYGLNHPRSGEVVLISEPRSWQAYYWWLSDDRAPALARTVDIHRKPGYDPLELYFDAATKGIPLDAGRIKGSHGAPAVDAGPAERDSGLGAGLFSRAVVADTDVFGVVLAAFRPESRRLRAEKITIVDSIIYPSMVISNGPAIISWPRHEYTYPGVCEFSRRLPCMGVRVFVAPGWRKDRPEARLPPAAATMMEKGRSRLR